MKKSKKAISVLLSLLLMFNLFIPAYAQAEINDSIKSEQTQVESTDSSSSEQAESENTDSSSSEPTESENADSSSSEQAESENADSSSSEQAESENADNSSSEQAESENADSSSSEQEETAEEFISLTVINPENDTVIAEVGEEVTLTANINRNDVSVNYQWQKMQMPIPKKEVKTEPIYNYPEGSPTWYNFPLEDKTENQVISENPNASWMGVEMYIATVNALNEIGADSSNVSFEWKTPNLVLDGYTISAEKEDVVKIIATKEDKQLVATLNENNKFQFGEEYLREVPTLNEWIDIPNANSESYTFTVAEQDLYSQYRLKVTITDEEYLNKCIEILKEQNVDLTEEQQNQEQNIYSIVMYVKSAEIEEKIADETETDGEIMTFKSAGTPYLSDDGQWICGLNGNFQYITENTYNRAKKWWKEGKITPSQFNMFWTYLNPKGFYYYEKANVLDENGFPTGETRTYNGFDLTDGNKLEVNSEWYGKTVYFRPAGTNNITKIKIPAYTEIYGAGDKYSDSVSGSKYKKAITFLNPYTKDTGSMYLNFLEFTSRNGWILEMLPDGSITSNKTDNHITAYAVDVESFNSDPARYMVDAEGNFRVDSVGWGVCTYQEPDLSGKAYHILKDYLSNGYGFLTGHDTLYGYAGAYYDAFGVELDESTIDANDGTTWYYDVNSWQPGTTATDQNGNKSTTRGGHFYLNQLVGTNKGNVYSNNVLPSDAPSMILSTGGSHGKYGKDTMYGGNSLNVVQQGYSAELAKNNPRYRTPTNYPYSFNEGMIFTSSFTHSNGQATFAPIWVKYNGKNQAPNATEQMHWTIGEKTGTNNFYLTGSGNYLMNQIGHLPTNSASNYESILFSNSVMYVSQRKQCEICAANQNGQHTSHFVRRISAANSKEILTALQNGGNFWYPLDGCYQLTEDITLDENWQPIKNFKGHWNSDVYKVNLNTKGTPLLANDKAQGEKGWNLGTDKNKGVINVFNKNMERTTGVARVVGDLNDLFGTQQNYAGYTVKILGSDNPKYMSANEIYSCTVNTDSKYIISNLPCIYDNNTKTGILNARVFDKNGSEITQYGDVRVKVDKNFWNNNMTIPLYLYKTKPEPIKDYVTFEGQDGFMIQGGIYSLEKVSDVQWQVKKKDTWENIENVQELKGHYEIAEPVFHDNSEESFTEVSLKLTNCQLSWSNWNFRAVFNYNGKQYDTFSVSAKDKSGKLIVKPWPAKIIQAEDKGVWVGENATFTSTIDFARGAEQGLKAEWQYKPVYSNDDEWFDVKTSDLFANGGNQTISSEITDISVYDVIAKKHNFKNYGKYRTTTSMTVENSDISFDGLLFRVKYHYTTDDGKQVEWYSNIANNRQYRWTENVSEYGENKIGEEVGNRMGHLSVKPADIAVVMQEAKNESGSNNYVDDLTPDVYGQKIQISAEESYSSDVAKYTAIIYYKPNADNMSVTPKWEYSTYLDRTSKDWNDNVAKGINGNIKVNIENTPLTTNGSSLPTNHKYYNEAYADWGAIKSVMTIENAVPEMYSTDTLTKYYFRCVADGTVKTQNGDVTAHGVGRNGGLVISHNILLNHMGVNTYDTENIINGKSITDMKGMAKITENREYSVWSYPQLRLVDQEKVNTINVKFGNNADSRDYISYSKDLADKYGIKYSNGDNKSMTFVADTKNSVETWQWEDFLRNMTFTVYDPMTISASGITGGVQIIWTADENKLPNLQNEINEKANNIIYNNQNGHFYELVETSYPVSFWEANTNAQEKGNQAGVSGYLVNINDENENIFVSDILKDTNSRYGWIGNNYQEELLWANKYAGSNSYMTYWTDTWKNVDIQNMNNYDALKIVFRPYPIYSPSTHPHAFEEYYKIIDINDRNVYQAMHDYDKYQYISRRVQLYDGGITFGPAQYGTTFYPTENDGRTFYSTKFTAIPYEVYGIKNGSSNGKKALQNVLREETITKTRQKFSNFAPPSNPSYTWRNLDDNGNNEVYAYVVEYDEDPTLRPDAKRITETDTIGTQISLPKGQKILAKVEDAKKIYNGTELMPKIEISVDGSDGQDLANLVTAIFATSTTTADYTTTTIDATNVSGSKVINTGVYSVKLSLTEYAKKLGYSFDWRSKTQAVLNVYPRPLNLKSQQNKIYDGNSNAQITNIVIDPASENSGIVNGDKVEFKQNNLLGIYVNSDEESQKDVGQWKIKRIDKLEFSVNPHNNYKIGGERYIGDITPRGLYVHSIYLEQQDKPRNVKSYDNTNSATVKDIIVDNIVDGDDVWVDKKEYLGTYEDVNAGETLNPDGTVKADRFKHLKENNITLTEKVSLINNEKGNYFIEKEKYTGAISRAVLDVMVKNHRYMYGNQGFGYPTYDELYTATSHSDSWLNISGLKGKDTINFDKNFDFNAQDKNGNTIEFTDKTFVGEYSITPKGLNEVNYPVLENYVVEVMGGRVEVYPREIIITPEESNRYIEDTDIPKAYAVFEMMNNDEKSYSNIGNDRENEYSDIHLIGSDTIENTILIGGKSPIKNEEKSIKEYGTDEKISVFENGSNIPYSTKWYQNAPVIYADLSNDNHTYPCDWCKSYHGFEMGTDHLRISGYQLSINQDKNQGNTLDVIEVENVMGKKVKNYKIKYNDNLLKVHPKLRFQLEATVPLQVCMYGYAGDGEVVEPENYGITNYSKGDIKVTDITVSNDGWSIVDKKPVDLLRGEMTMRMNDTQLVVGNNKPLNPDKWIITKDTSDNRLGNKMIIPIQAYIAGGNVNERQESYIANVTFTIDEHRIINK